jgi:hypothetical protein
MKAAFETAAAANLEKGTPAYKETFKKVLDSYPLELFGQSHTYRSAFLTSRLAPASKPRIYGGTGTVAFISDSIVIADADEWPKEYQSSERLPFVVTLPGVSPDDAVAPHIKARDELEHLGNTRGKVRWWAYGLPLPDAAGRWMLPVASLDHIYWEVLPSQLPRR